MATNFNTGTYDVGTGVYTSPSGDKQSRRAENVPSGTQMIFTRGSGGTIYGGGSGGTSAGQTLIPEQVQTQIESKRIAEENLNNWTSNLKNYYAAQITSGTTYTPQKLYSLKQDNILNYASRYGYEENKGVRRIS